MPVPEKTTVAGADRKLRSELKKSIDENTEQQIATREALEDSLRSGSRRGDGNGSGTALKWLAGIVASLVVVTVAGTGAMVLNHQDRLTVIETHIKEEEPLTVEGSRAMRAELLRMMDRAIVREMREHETRVH